MRSRRHRQTCTATRSCAYLAWVPPSSGWSESNFKTGHVTFLDTRGCVSISVNSGAALSGDVLGGEHPGPRADVRKEMCGIHSRLPAHTVHMSVNTQTAFFSTGMTLPRVRGVAARFT